MNDFIKRQELLLDETMNDVQKLLHVDFFFDLDENGHFNVVRTYKSCLYWYFISQGLKIYRVIKHPKHYINYLRFKKYYDI